MSTIYSIVQASHSGLRWFVLILMVLTIIRFLYKWRNDEPYLKGDKTMFTVNLSLLHFQIILGFILYFVSPKVQFSGAAMASPVFRFFTLEHVVLMLISVTLVTIASAKIKRKEESRLKFKTGFWYSLIALIFLLAAIPWPFQNLGTGWF